jgi:predicted Fe-Mo cluster-binding NifX family protein
MELICVPSIDGNGLKGKVSQHLGKTPYFVLINYEEDKIKGFQVLESKGKHMGGQITPGEFITSSGAQTLLCGNLGHKAIQMLQKAGINIYVGASGNVIEAVHDWSEGKLKEASLDSACADGHI